MSDLPHWTHEVDCEGLLCPLPVLRAAKRLRMMAPGAILCLRATDRMAAIDLPHYCAQTGHDYLGSQDLAGSPDQTRSPFGPVTLHLIRRGPDATTDPETQAPPDK